MGVADEFLFNQFEDRLLLRFDHEVLNFGYRAILQLFIILASFRGVH